MWSALELLVAFEIKNQNSSSLRGMEYNRIVKG